MAIPLLRRALVKASDFLPGAFADLLLDFTDVGTSPTQVGIEFKIQPANYVFCGPSSGASSSPFFRPLVAADVDAAASFIDPAAISGFSIRTTTTTITVGAGYAKTGTGIFVTYSGGTLSPARAANTTYYLYLLDNGTISVTSLAPLATIFGSARRLFATTGSRFIGSVRTNAIGNYILQASDAGDHQVNVNFLHNVGSTSRIITLGSSGVAADVNCSGFAPPTVTNVLTFRIQNNSTTLGDLVRYYIWTGSAFTIYSNVPYTGVVATSVSCDTTPKIQYDTTGAATANFDLLGYGLAR